MNLENPYLHPRWDDQVALEREMLVEGKDRSKRRLEKAMAKGNLTNLRPHRNLLKEWVEPVSKTITAWVDEFSASGKRGPRPVSLPFIKDMDPQVLAVVALRSVLRMLGIEKRGLLGIAHEIGTWVEHEMRAMEWQAQDPESWAAMTGSYKARGSNAEHMRRSRMAVFNKYISEKVVWRYWSGDERNRVGLTLLDCVIRGTKRFRVANDPEHFGKKGQKPQLILEADHELTAWIKGALEDEEIMWPVFMPTIIPPKPWVGPRDGGYWTPFVRTPFLIRFKASHEEQRMRALDDYDAIDMPLVYKALNHVQNTAWKINTRTLDVAQRIWDNDLAFAGFPRREQEVVSPRPEEAEPDELKEWYRYAAEVNTRNAKVVSKILTMSRCLVAANRFRDEPAIYFPHMLDFRGRMYPIPSDLQPQGQDIHRGLLTFSEAKPVTAEDAGWLAIQVANTLGVDSVDKGSFEDRIDWVEQNEDIWRSIADDPIRDKRWAIWKGKPVKECWQALAAIFEWVRWLDEGEGMLSSLPVRIDGTCNGIQHLSAMVRDEVSAASVNLLPADKPRDIYGEIATSLTKRLHALGVGYPAEWLELVGGHVPRDLTKRPVMILPYGGTRHAYWGYTMEWLRDKDPNHLLWDKDKKIKNTSSLVPVLWETVRNSSVGNAMKTMEWLQDNARVASKTGRPLYWTTPSGFVVRHFYALEDVERIDVQIDGSRIQLVNYRETKDLDTKAQERGIAPNFVHSMDASAMTTTMNYCELAGINSVTVIHDSYGSVAGDMHKLAAMIRKAFVWTYEHNVLEDFQTSCQQVARDLKDAEWPALPEMGTLDIKEVENADYFFA